MSTEAPQRLGTVLPVLIAALVCDTHALDPSTGKKSLIGIFDRVNAMSFPVARPATVYYKLADAEGRYEFEVRYARRGGEEKLAQATGEFVSRDRLRAFELVIPFPNLPVPEAGRYEFQLWANSMYIGTAVIDAATATPG